MKLRHPLHEFMPYGAPDLLVARRPDLSRALTVSAAAAFSLFALIAGLSTLAPREVVRLPDPRVILPLPPVPPSLVQPIPQSGPPKAVVHPASKFALPKIVPNEPPETQPLPPGYDDLAKQVQNGSGSATKTPVIDGRIGLAPPAEDPDRPVSCAEVWPVAITEVKPEYPSIARDAMVDGQVIVLVLIGRDGRVREAKVDVNHHVPMLDEAALSAARTWVFSPALSGGHPVAVWSAIPFRFTLH
jgi:protein TonB